MDNRLDMSLDDLIKKNKSSSSRADGGGYRGGGGRGRGRGGAAPSRRFANRTAARASPYAMMPKAPETFWQHDMFGNQVGLLGGGVGGVVGGASAIETGTKLYISNLDYGVSNDDIKELFSEVGDLKRHSIHYDRSGRSKGTAEVVFSRRVDAMAAVKRYNNVELDGKPMKIEIVGPNVANPGAGVLPPAMNGFPRNPVGITRNVPRRGGPMLRPRGGGRGFGRGGRGPRRGREEKVVSAEQLDADLESYHKEANQETMKE